MSGGVMMRVLTWMMIMIEQDNLTVSAVWFAANDLAENYRYHHLCLCVFGNSMRKQVFLARARTTAPSMGAISGTPPSDLRFFLGFTAAFCSPTGKIVHSQQLRRNHGRAFGCGQQFRIVKRRSSLHERKAPSSVNSVHTKCVKSRSALTFDLWSSRLW